MECPPLVSVILPTYNRAKLIQRAIDSVLTQTYPHWELIVWDDGSMDDTRNIINSYGDERIKYWYDTNHGVAYARNCAIKVSNGKYLAFLDSDDEWSEDKLITQVEVMNIHLEVDILFGNFVNKNGSTRQDQPAFEQYSNLMKLLNVEHVAEQLFVIKSGLMESLMVENIIATDTVIIRREVISRVGYFIEELRNSEDLELWWRMGLESVCFAYLEKVCLIRNKLSGTLSASSILGCENSLKALDICLREALSKGRRDLIHSLNTPYRNVWQNMIFLYAGLGNPGGMINAFIQTMKYGFRWGSVRLLLESATGLQLRRG